MSLLLEMFSNIIQYQYVGNAHLVYAIVRRQEVRGGGGCILYPTGCRLLGVAVEREEARDARRP